MDASILIEACIFNERGLTTEARICGTKAWIVRALKMQTSIVFISGFFAVTVQSSMDPDVCGPAAPPKKLPEVAECYWTKVHVSV